MNVSIHADGRHPGAVIRKNIYGHFSEHLGRCIYGGLYVGEDSAIPNVRGIRTDVVGALREIRVPVLRWPGGCFADEYHWEDGVGPKETRKRMVNTNWGGVVEDNSFGTHEFLDLCGQIGCEPYINMNVGSGSVREMAEWVEYLNSEGDSTLVRRRWANGQREPFHVKYIGVGNENWGCGGMMRAEYYADEYRRYQNFCRTYGKDRPCRIACGPSGEDWRWTETLMERAANCMDALTLHYYTIPHGDWNAKGQAREFDAAGYYDVVRRAGDIDRLVRLHTGVMDCFDPEHRVGLIVDEWGTWYDVERGTNPGFLYQQNTMRDAMVAALTLNVFNAHADRVVMANIAQMVNVLQSVVLTDGDRMVLTPTWHVFDLYKEHQDAALAETSVHCGTIEEGLRHVSASASVKDGVMTVTCANLSLTEPAEVLLDAEGFEGCAASGRILTGEAHSCNDFDRPDAVRTAALTGIARTERGFTFTLPPTSVAAVTLR